MMSYVKFTQAAFARAPFGERRVSNKLAKIHSASLLRLILFFFSHFLGRQVEKMGSHVLSGHHSLLSVDGQMLH